MSHEVVRSIRIKDGEVWITGHCSNVTDWSGRFIYRKWECTALSQMIAEQGRQKAECELVRLYDEGHLQGGSNVF